MERSSAMATTRAAYTPVEFLKVSSLLSCRLSRQASSNLSLTSKPLERLDWQFPLRCSHLLTRSSNDPPSRVHHSARRRGCDVADRGAGAADGDAGDRVFEQRVSRSRR